MKYPHCFPPSTIPFHMLLAEAVFGPNTSGEKLPMFLPLSWGGTYCRWSFSESKAMSC